MAEAFDYSCGALAIDFALPFRRAAAETPSMIGRAHGTRILRTFRVEFESESFGWWRLVKRHHERTAGSFAASLPSIPDPVRVEYAEAPRATPVSPARVAVSVVLIEALATSAT